MAKYSCIYSSEHFLVFCLQNKVDWRHIYADSDRNNEIFSQIIILEQLPDKEELFTIQRGLTW
jgi:hypothetical protein